MTENISKKKSTQKNHTDSSRFIQDYAKGQGARQSVQYRGSPSDIILCGIHHTSYEEPVISRKIEYMVKQVLPINSLSKWSYKC